MPWTWMTWRLAGALGITWLSLAWWNTAGAQVIVSPIPPRGIVFDDPDDLEDYYEDLRERREDYYEDLRERREDYLEELRERREDYYDDLDDDHEFRRRPLWHHGLGRYAPAPPPVYLERRYYVAPLPGAYAVPPPVYGPVPIPGGLYRYPYSGGRVFIGGPLGGVDVRW